VARTVDRFIRRGAACCLCSAWPAPCDHHVNGHLLLLCRTCEARPDAMARLTELVTVDWRRTPEPDLIG
jgi:hypothetical protein